MFATNAHKPARLSWCVCDEAVIELLSFKSKTPPGVVMSVNCKINANRLIVYYRAACNWVGFLFPLITPIQSGVDNLEMELSIFSFEVFQLEQFGEQESFCVIRVLSDSISIGLTKQFTITSLTYKIMIFNYRKQSSGSIMGKHFDPTLKWKNRNNF